MSKLKNLIAELCPNGVEFKPLGEIAEMQRGTSLTKKNSVGGNYPVISGGREPAFYCNQYNREGETITVAGSGAGAGFVQFWNQKIFVNDAFSVKGTEKILTKYIYYCLTNLQKEIYATKKGGGVPHVHISSIENFKIPVPPLEVQAEIVRILDTFTKLTAKLTAELALRKKQYEYYRDKLLTFENVEFKTLKLKDLCKSIKDGMHNLPKSTLENGEYPILSAMNIYDNQIDYNAKRYVDWKTFEQENKRINIQVGDVLLTIVATIGRSAIVKDDRQILLQRSVCALKPNEKILSGYLKYYLDKKEIQDYMIANAHGSAQAGLYLNQVEQIKIPVPPLAEQERIVKILDKFDKLCNDLRAGLPAEIAARKKQYEYYRDKLLTFEEAR